ncbi:MAG TPA: FkbM family methyltransferase [Candidatus Acidoferrales bacterium]|jgi:FkbM family methyltransferase
MSKGALPALKGGVQKLLTRAGIYERARSSWIYDFYWGLANKNIIDDRQSEVEFYRTLLDGLREGHLIFDVGANRGYKTDIFLRLGAAVVAVEPDEACQEILKQKFLKYRFKKKRLVIVSRAVSDTSSTVAMWIDGPGSAMNTLSQKWAETLRDDDRFGQRLSFGQRREVETVSIEQLIAAHGSPFFIKIDVEGHELNVLRGMQRPVPFLSFEVNLPDFRSEGLECIQVLERLARDGKFNYTADCRRGLVLKEWITGDEISSVLDSCKDESIEVFWKTSVREP